MAADTPFPIFSITKMFAAALAVKLAQEGRLKLDDPLNGTLPDWPNADRITLRMLLNQTSGIGNNQRRLEHDTAARPRTVWAPQKTLSYAPPGEKWSTTTPTTSSRGSSSNTPPAARRPRRCAK